MSGVCLSHFDDVAEFYDGMPNPMLALEERFLTGLLPEVRAKDVVEVGCGTGRWLRRFDRRQTRSLTGIDPSIQMLDVARQHLSGQVVLQRGCAEELPLPNGSADIVLMSFVLSYCQDAERVITEMVRVARPGARIILTDVHPETESQLKWQRSFRSGSGAVVMPSKRHMPATLTRAFQNVDWHCKSFLEVPFGKEERAIFAATGRGDYYDAIASLPAIYIAIFESAPAESADLSLHGASIALNPETAIQASVEIHNRKIAKMMGETRFSTDVGIDLGGYLVLPGLINAHDHLEFGLYPNLGHGPYNTCREWAEDIHTCERNEIASQSRVPKDVRLYWGALRNLLCGVTTVCHHNPLSSTLQADNFPVRVVENIAWAHSLSFDSQVVEKFNDSVADWPFIIHAAEGIDRSTTQEAAELERMGVLSERTVLVHGVNLSAEDIERVNAREASLILCPTSNHFLFGRSIDASLIPRLKNKALGTDSPLTAAGDFLDEVRFAKKWSSLPDTELYEMCTSRSASILKLRKGEGSIRIGGNADLFAILDRGGAPSSHLPQLRLEDIHLVVVQGRIHLASPELLDRFPADLRNGLHPLFIDETLRWVRAPLPWMFEETERILGNPVYLGGKRVAYAG